MRHSSSGCTLPILCVLQRRCAIVNECKFQFWYSDVPLWWLGRSATLRKSTYQSYQSMCLCWSRHHREFAARHWCKRGRIYRRRQKWPIIPSHWLEPRSDVAYANVPAIKRRQAVPLLLINQSQNRTLQKATTVGYFQILTDDIKAKHSTERDIARTAVIFGVESVPEASP